MELQDFYWLVYYPDWSGMAAFASNDELSARRYAMENTMSMRAQRWGEINRNSAGE